MWNELVVPVQCVEGWLSALQTSSPSYHPVSNHPFLWSVLQRKAFLLHVYLATSGTTGQAFFWRGDHSCLVSEWSPDGFKCQPVSKSVHARPKADLGLLYQWLEDAVSLSKMTLQWSQSYGKTVQIFRDNWSDSQALWMLLISQTHLPYEAWWQCISNVEVECTQ